MADIFISYRNLPEQRAIVRRLATILRNHGVSVWWDYGLEAGESYREQITRELASATIVLPLWCAQSVISKWVLMEAEMGRDKLLPAKLQQVVPPDAFESIQAADLTGWNGSVSHPRAMAFVRLICQRLGKTATAPADLLEELSDLKELSPLPVVPVRPAMVDTEMPPKPSTLATAHEAKPHETGGAPPPRSAEDAYEAIKDSDDPSEWEAFVEDHGDSDFAIVARPKTMQLRAQQEHQQRAAHAKQREGTAAELWRHLRDIDDGNAIADFFKRFDNKHVAAEAARENGYAISPVGRGGSEDEQRLLKPGDTFQDAEFAPEMVVVPPGSFMMGSKDGEGDNDEHPPHEVTLAEPFAVSVAPITRGQFAAFIKQTAHDMSGGAYGWTGSKWKKDDKYSWLNPGFKQTDDHPVVCVNWHDAQAYIKWLHDQTGAKPYRLLSEAEWEYCCRATSNGPYYTGVDITKAQANFGRNENGTTPVITELLKYTPNKWGLRDMHGNVWEWCEDNWHKDYNGDPPDDGSVWQGGDTSLRVARGGSWYDLPQYLRSANRNRSQPVNRYSGIGFRLARTLTP